MLIEAFIFHNGMYFKMLFPATLNRTDRNLYSRTFAGNLNVKIYFIFQIGSFANDITQRVRVICK